MDQVDKVASKSVEQMTSTNEPYSLQEQVYKQPSEDRLVMLSDGIFAIAVTLLVINIKLPSGLSEAQFNAKLADLLSSDILFYLITFVVVASYWRFHRRLLHIVKRLDNGFIMLNLLFLIFVAFFPVSSSIIEGYSYRNAVIFYTLTVAGCGFSALVAWLYASWHHRLIDPAMTREAIISFSINTVHASVFFCLSLLLLFSPIKPVDIFWTWLLVPLFNLLIARLSRGKLMGWIAASGTNSR